MVFRFDDVEIDPDRRELRRGGAVRSLQPQAYAVLEYLVRHRDRVVPKQELLDTLWPDAVVSEGSVHRAVSLARQAIDDDGRRIKNVPKLGYRFVGEVAVVEGARPAAPAGRPRFARSGAVHIAYQTLGEGELDLVLVHGWVLPMRALLDEPVLRAQVEALTRFGRVVLFDKRGTGLSDRVTSLPTLEQRMDDLRAVLDEIGSRQVLLVGYSEGGALCLLYATACPERTRGVVLASAFARWTATPDYAPGWTGQDIQRLRDYIGTRWGAGQTLIMTVASRAADPAIQAWAARAEQEGASPGAALQLLDMNAQVDVRPLLPAVTVPVIALCHTRDAVIRADSSRYLASRIPGARLVEVDGTDHLFVFEGGDDLVAAIEALLVMPRGREESFLTTLVALAGGAAAGAAELAAAHRGEPAGDRLFCFDGPQRAIRFADTQARRDPEVAAGVHTGEAARARDGLTGAAVDVARRIAAAARPGEVLVSRVVRDLVHGSGFGLAPSQDVALGDGAALEALALVRER